MWRRRSVSAVLISFLLSAVGAVVAAPVAVADTPIDPLIVAVVDHLTPTLPKVSVAAAMTDQGPQFVVDNPTPTELIVLSSAGDPFLRIGPQGVLANIRSPQWYTSKTPAAGVSIPAEAIDHAAPLWGRVSDTPQWGWYDTRLEPPQLTSAQVASASPLQHFGDWTVPIQYGGQLGTISGHFEYRPPLGQFSSVLNQTQPLPGVALEVLPGNPTPALSIANTGNAEISVLGDVGEPFLKIRPDETQANNLSPTWFALQNADNQQSLRDSGVTPDAHAAPKWVTAGSGGQYSFLLNRASPTLDLPALYAVSSPTVVSKWTVTLVTGTTRVDVAGTTTLIPTGYQPSAWWQSPLLWIAVVALVLALAAAVLMRHRRGARPALSGRRSRVTVRGGKG